MDTQLLIMARLRMPERAYRAWLAKRLDGNTLDWFDEGDLFVGDSASEFPTVDALLRAANDATGDQRPALAVRVEDEQLTLLAVLTDDEQILRWHQDLATALRLAAGPDVSGYALMWLPAGGIGWWVVDDQGETLDPFTGERAHEIDARFPREVSLLNLWLSRSAHDPSLRFAEFLEHALRLELGPLAENAAQQRLLRALRTCDPNELWELTNEIRAADNSGSLRSQYADAAALTAGLAGGDAQLRAVGVLLLAHVDPEAAELLAHALLNDPSSYVRRAAIEAMGQFESDAALAVLLTLPEFTDEYTQARLAALADSPHPELEARLEALLDDPDLFGAGAFQIDDIDDAAQRKALECRLNRAAQTLQLIASAAPELAERLAAMFISPPVAVLRGPIASALVQIQGPAVTAIADQLQAYTMGMGLALNQDQARRQELLGHNLDTRETNGVTRFSGLPPERLATLVEEMFLHPQWQHSDAPPAVAFFEFLSHFPGTTAGGYAISNARPDYRIGLDSVSCDLSELAADAQANLREAFAVFSEGADRVDEDAHLLHAWWR